MYICILCLFKYLCAYNVYTYEYMYTARNPFYLPVCVHVCIYIYMYIGILYVCIYLCAYNVYICIRLAIHFLCLDDS